MRKLFMGAAVAAMVAGSSVAQAAPIADARSGAPVAEAEGLMSQHLWLGVLAAVLLGLVIWQINDNDADDNFPVSP
jgi:hypothetical protein